MGEKEKQANTENTPKNDVLDEERRKYLKKIGVIGIAATTAPVMITLLKATQASAQSGVNPEV